MTPKVKLGRPRILEQPTRNARVRLPYDIWHQVIDECDQLDSPSVSDRVRQIVTEHFSKVREQSTPREKSGTASAMATKKNSAERGRTHRAFIRGAVAMEQAYPIGTKVTYIGRNKDYTGHQAEVAGYSGERGVGVKFANAQLLIVSPNSLEPAK